MNEIIIVDEYMNEVYILLFSLVCTLLYETK